MFVSTSLRELEIQTETLSTDEARRLIRVSRKRGHRKDRQVDGYSYRIKVENTAEKVVEILFWEFQSIDPANSSSLTRRQFLCGVNIRPGKESSLEGFSISSPSNVVNVDTLAKKDQNPLQERIVINRVEYADGTIWQRKDWSLNEVKASYQRALNEPWTLGMCKGL